MPWCLKAVFWPLPRKSTQNSKSLFLQKSRFCSSQSLRSSFGRGSWNALHPVRALRLHTTLGTLHRSTQRRCGSQNFATWRIWYAPDRQHPTNSDFGALIHASDAMRQQALRQPTPTFSGQKVKHQTISIYLTHVFLDSMMFSCSSSSKRASQDQQPRPSYLYWYRNGWSFTQNPLVAVCLLDSIVWRKKWE